MTSRSESRKTKSSKHRCESKPTYLILMQKTYLQTTSWRIPMSPRPNRHIRFLLAMMFVLCGSALISTPVRAQSDLIELIPSKAITPPVVPGASPWTAGVKLAAQFLGWLSDQGLKSNINGKIEELKPKIDAAMPAKGGVLIVVGIQQSEQPDANGNYFRSVLDGYVGSAGATPKAAMDAYLAKDRLEQGTAKGFIRRNVYFWKSAPSPSG
jgi:hypothetical protein